MCNNAFTILFIQRLKIITFCLPERSPETKADSPCFWPCWEPQNVHIRLNRTIHNAGCLEIAMLSRMLQGYIIHYPVYLSIAGLFSSSISALSHTCNTNNITSLGFLTPGSLAGSILSLITNTVFKHSGLFYCLCFASRPLATNDVYPSGCSAAQWLVLVVGEKKKKKSSSTLSKHIFGYSVSQILYVNSVESLFEWHCSTLGRRSLWQHTGNKLL